MGFEIQIVWTQETLALTDLRIDQINGSDICDWCMVLADLSRRIYASIKMSLVGARWTRVSPGSFA